MQHKEALPFSITQVIENEGNEKSHFFVCVSMNATDGIYRGYFKLHSKRRRFIRNLVTTPPSSFPRRRESSLLNGSLATPYNVSLRDVCFTGFLHRQEWLTWMPQFQSATNPYSLVCPLRYCSIDCAAFAGLFNR